MSPNLPNNKKNLIDMRKIKNFKTQKFKHRIKDHLLYYSQLHFHHHHYPLPFYCKTNFNCMRIYNVTSMPSVLSDMSLEQTVSNFQLSIITNNYSKMSLLLVLLLSIVASHIANCQKNLERDNNILFFSKNNTLSEHLLQYVRSKQSENDKSLIVDRRNIINDKIVKYAFNYTNYPEQKTVLTALNNFNILWSNRSRESINDIHFLEIGSNRFNKEDKNVYSRGENVKDEKSKITAPHVIEKINTFKQNLSSSFPLTGDDQYLLKIVMEGLGLQKLPDFKEANISQIEYVTKYNEYLKRVRERNNRELEQIDSILNQSDDADTSLSLITITHNASEAHIYRHRRSSTKRKVSHDKTILLKFPLNIETDLEASDIEEANIRLLLITSPALANRNPKKRRGRFRGNGEVNKSHLIDLNQKKNATANKKPNKKIEEGPQKHIINMKVYQLLEPKGRVWIDGRKIEIKIDKQKEDETTSQWLQFDVTKAVESWLINKDQNLGLEIQCDNCFKNGARIIDDLSGDSEEDSISDDYDLTPVLNIIGKLGTHREKRSKHHHKQMTEKPERRLRKNNCFKDNQRCCRHTMEVVFKEIKGFEFIIQPKVFDAGYCRGRCPPRYNPAHHHALLQSLISKQNRTKVPRPCCAPSKLIELEVLHVDEKDNEKLKISTWTDMRVLECACS